MHTQDTQNTHRSSHKAICKALAAATRDALATIPETIAFQFAPTDFAICFGTEGDLRALQSLYPRPKAITKFLERRWTELKKDLRFHNAVHLLLCGSRLTTTTNDHFGSDFRVVGGSIVTIMKRWSAAGSCIFNPHSGWMQPESWKDISNDQPWLLKSIEASPNKKHLA